MKLAGLAQQFSDDDKARGFLEKLLWPGGPVCPHCGLVGEAYKLEPRRNSKRPVRKGVWKCKRCSKQFTVTVSTIFSDSHIPLHKWLLAIHLICASKKGMSAHQLHRMLGVTYKSAWFMAHRIRWAMSQHHFDPKSKMSGPENIVEVDETFVGGKEKGVIGLPDVYRSKKTPVVSLVERKGKVRSFPVERVTVKNLKPILAECVSPTANLMTDDNAVYYFMRDKFSKHDVVNHAKKEYVRYENGKAITTNSVEGYFSILKRGIYGVYQHVGRQHLHRYLSEFDFRYNSRDVKDGERAALVIQATSGKRLTYKKPSEGLVC